MRKLTKENNSGISATLTVEAPRSQSLQTVDLILTVTDNR